MLLAAGVAPPVMAAHGGAGAGLLLHGHCGHCVS